MDYTQKKEMLVTNMVLRVRELLQSLEQLDELKTEFQVLGDDIANEDTFSYGQNQHLTGYDVNYTLTTVIPAITATLEANTNTFKNHLYKVK